MGIPDEEIIAKGKIDMHRRVSIFILCVLTVAAVAGCVTAPEPAINRISGAPGSLTPGYDVVYYPQVPADKTGNAVLSDFQQTKRGTIWVYMGEDYLTYSRPSIVKNIAFQNNRVEILYQRVGTTNTQTFTFFYYQLMNTTIAAQAGRDGRSGRYAIIIPEVVTFRAVDLATTQRFADTLFFRQQQVKNYAKQLDEQLVRFEPVAAEYRALAVKPAVSEEQRKLIVQANALAQQKEYGKALAFYQKGIQIDRTAYPAAYFNMALLAAQEHLPVTAIFYMRHYLLLRPDAKDARSAQDKIYEWEMLIKQ